MQNQEPIKPLLFDYISARTHGDEIPGSYDAEYKMWVVNHDGQRQPIIESSQTLAELTTKTDTVSEGDDQSRGPRLETVTKTMNNTESDDEIQCSSALAEMTTKTRVELESDDHTTRLRHMFL